jgi:2-desacetyl-2-hydroxyethyl bacteriochlorophyllide A dehydrogenase
MRSIVCIEPGKFEYRDMTPPELSPGHALLRIKRIGICGTDLHAFEGTQPFFSYPRILGHELAGDLIEADNAPGFVPGETVTFLPYFNCLTCIACRNGKPNCCVNLKVCGVHINGGMVDYLTVPSHTLVKSEGLGYDELALIEPLSIGAHSVRRAQVARNEFVLVIGGGPIGIGVMEFARIAGARVIALDINEQRLQFIRNNLKIDFTINASKENAFEKVRDITGGDMPAAVFDATGNQQAINGGLQYLAHGGRYILVGLQRNDLIFNHPEFHKREASLMSSRNATREDFMHVIRSIRERSIDPLPLITHRVKFEGLNDVFKQWLNPQTGVIKGVVEME